MIDYARCACDEGWKGTKCELNAAEVFNIASSPSATDTAGMQNVFDDNGILKETVQQAKKMVVLFNWVQGGLGMLAAAALFSSTVMAVLSSGCDDSDFVVLFNWVQGGLGMLAAAALFSSTVMAVLSSGCDDSDFVVLFNWVQGGLGMLAAAALFSSTIMAVLSSGCDDSDFIPQALFQSHRLRSIVIAAAATFYARNPYRYNLDIYYGCRFYYWLVNTAYAVGQCLWTAEAMNVERMFGSTQFNRWKRWQNSNDRQTLTYLISLPPCYIVPFVTVATAIMTNWKSVCRSSSCIGSFSEETFPLQMALIALNGSLMIASIALSESAFLIKRHCMEREITRCEYFLSNWPYELGKCMMTVERNLPFVPIGSILHFACWVAVTLATDKEDTAFTVVAVLCLVSYSVFIVVQLIFTEAELYKYATIFSIIFLPKSMSPKFEFFDMLTRDEVLASWKPQKYLKEKKDAEEAKERERQQDANKIKHDNEQLLQKYPNLPPLLLFNVPEEGAPRMFPNSFPLLPTDDDYVPEWNRMMMQDSWTEKYVACRRTGMDVDESIKAFTNICITA
uniref:EGF-like domain-containing protein n=1 Tax=Ascaris lumbricoides TaxID=6252 RepID=A0A0M3ILJ0_ASCLU